MRNWLPISVSAPRASARKYLVLTQRQRIEQESKDKQIIHIQLVKAEKAKEEREIKASAQRKQLKAHQHPNPSQEARPTSEAKKESTFKSESGQPRQDEPLCLKKV